MKKITSLMAILAAGALALTGCTSVLGDGETEPVGVAPTDITIAVAADITSLDALKGTGLDFQLLSLVNAPLFRSGDDLQPVPDLAESVERPDDLTVVVTLKDATFSDGSPVTSADVKWTYDRVLDPANGNIQRGILAVIASVEATDEKTVTFKLSTPSPDILFFMGLIGIQSEAYLSADPTLQATEPIGAGPYTVQSYVAASELVLAANPDYVNGPPRFETVTVKFIPDPSARILALQAGDVEYAAQVPVSEVATLQADENVNVQNGPAVNLSYLGVNFENPALQDPKVRQAIAYGIDIEQIRIAVYQDLTEIPKGIANQDLWWASPNAQTYEYNPEKAQDLLADAGYEDGLSLTLASSDESWNQETATIIKSQLAEIGVEVTTSVTPYTTFIANGREGQILGDLVLGFGWNNVLIPFQALNRQLMGNQFPPAGLNYMRYSNPDVDALLLEGAAETDEETRAEAYREALDIMSEDLPWILLANVSEFGAASTAIPGFESVPVASESKFYALVMGTATP